jgi:hypothetical protein
MNIRYAFLFSLFSFFGYSQTLIHYWHFNNLSGTVDSVQADYSALPTSPWISFPGTGAGFLDDVNDGDTLNLRMGQNDGRGLRVRNPSDTRMLMIPMPTTDFEDIQFSYAVKRTNNGAQKQWLSFSTDNGQTWSNAAPFNDTVLVGLDYVVESFDFSSLGAANDNPDFWVRIEFFAGSDNSSGNNRFDNIVLEGSPLGGGSTPTGALIHYWHFNGISGTVSGPVDADYSRIPNVTPSLDYIGSGDGFMDEFSPGSGLNLQRGEPAGLALRVRNPSFDRALIIELPTTECSDIVLMYDAHRSGSGMLFNNVAYTVDGVNYDTVGMGISMVSITESYQTFTFDFSGIAAANDNPNFKVRITWSGNTNQPNGNNRYDNIAMFAGSTTLSSQLIESDFQELKIFPQPATDYVVLSGLDADKVQLISMNGACVLDAEVKNKTEVRLEVGHLPKGSYLIRTFKGASMQVKRIVIQ